MHIESCRSSGTTLPFWTFRFNKIRKKIEANSNMVSHDATFLETGKLVAVKYVVQTILPFI